MGKSRRSLRRITLQDILGWIIVPSLCVVTIALLYLFVFARVQPGTMDSRVVTPHHFTKFTIKHIQVILIASSLAILVGIPAGILITRPGFRDFAGLILGLANIGQTVPSMAILGLSYIFLGLGLKPSIFALWLYALLPIVRNTSVGIEEVDPAIIEAARGMGMTQRQILTRIEIPLALRVIFAGIRTAVVINVGTAALATFIGWPTLGQPIATGIRVRRNAMVISGGTVTAVFAILLDFIMGKAEALVAPPH